MEKLHVLNGDATFRGFEETGLGGDVIVWREMLSEGPLEENITSGSFWKTRSLWLSETFPDSAYDYQSKMLDQLAMLNEPYDEINLWFEFDLHCQANLLGVLMMLKQRTDLSAPNVFLICPSDYPGKENFMGMGELNGEELEYLYDNLRIQLSALDFSLAAEAWAVFVTRDAVNLKKWLSGLVYWGNLTLLKPALEVHLKTITTNSAGLNFIEQKLLDLYNSGLRDRTAIFTAFWSTEKIFGMGDSVLDLYLRRLIEKHLINL